MTEPSLFHRLPTELLEHVQDLEQGNFANILTSDLTCLLLGHADEDSVRAVKLADFANWNDYIFRRLEKLLAGTEAVRLRNAEFLSLVAAAALQTFVQSNVTGPPLTFDVSRVILPSDVVQDPTLSAKVRMHLLESLRVDGIPPYNLTPNVELLCLADTILAAPSIKKNVPSAIWTSLRVNFLHQRLLEEPSSTLQQLIYEQLEQLESFVDSINIPGEYQRFLLERASIHLHHGFDRKARDDLALVSSHRNFHFALTGALGKKTKYQERDISQLVVLARSDASPRDIASDKEEVVHPRSTMQPQTLDLNDDTLLDSIAFTQASVSSANFKGMSDIPPLLRDMDPNDQSRLQPLDSVTLLTLASSITNERPADGLTREETLPYALRVLEGGSSNWQIYTQALLVRSRIDAYRSRTTERGLLQLQTLVDQVIAETTPDTGGSSAVPNTSGTTTFLPRAKESESAPAGERLDYVYVLCSPTRWELEAELAARWVSLGGLRSALEIYERLEMWAEAALCWAATEREDKAKAIIRRQLNHATNGQDSEIDPDTETWMGKPREPTPSDAPRLYCILADIDHDPEMYEKAWEVSNKRYARAQRSLGRLYFAAHDFVKSADAYTKALQINQLNGGSWFALGCALLELAQFDRAVEAFARTVQLDDTDAEAWSNLAAALMRRGPKSSESPSGQTQQDDTPIAEKNGDDAVKASHADPEMHKRDALRAFKRAAGLKYDNARIWDNVMTVAAELHPPNYTDLIVAQTRVIELRAKAEGESCIDADILDGLVRHVVATYPSPSTSNADGDDAQTSATRPGSVPALVIRLIDKDVKPLITHSTRLWRAVATIALWQNKPGSALDANEKAWRAATNANEGWETGKEEQWKEVVEATVQLVDAYENLGPRERTEGLATGSGELVAKDWRFKARSAARGIMGRAKESWEDTEGWDMLKATLDGLKG